MKIQTQSGFTTCAADRPRIRRSNARLLLATLPLVAVLSAPLVAMAEKQPLAPEENPRLTAAEGLRIDSVIEQDSKSNASKMLEQGFVIECSDRFESGCRLFLKTQ